MILLVEDNPDDVSLTLRALRQQGFSQEVMVARDGEEALDFLLGREKFNENRTREKPSLVLLDLKLPKVDGLEVVKQLRENSETRFLPVVVLTTSEEDSDVLNSYSLGVNSYIRKPVDFDNFKKALEAITSYWLSLNIIPTYQDQREDCL